MPEIAILAALILVEVVVMGVVGLVLRAAVVLVAIKDVLVTVKVIVAPDVMVIVKVPVEAVVRVAVVIGQLLTLDLADLAREYKFDKSQNFIYNININKQS